MDVPPRQRPPMFLHADLAVKSLDRSLAFYVEQLGWTLDDQAVVVGDIARAWSHGRCERLRIAIVNPSTIGGGVELVEGVDVTLTAAPQGRGVGVSLLVDDLDAATARLIERDIQPVAQGVVAMPVYGERRIALYEDPDGYLIEFVERPGSAS